MTELERRDVLELKRMIRLVAYYEKEIGDYAYLSWVRTYDMYTKETFEKGRDRERISTVVFAVLSFLIGYYSCAI